MVYEKQNIFFPVFSTVCLENQWEIRRSKILWDVGFDENTWDAFFGKTGGNKTNHFMGK